MEPLNPKNPHYSTLQKHFSIIVFLIIGATFFLFFSSFPLNSSKSLLPFQSLQCPSSLPNQPTTTRIQRDELGETLERASMANKTIIIAVVDRAYVQGEGGIPNMLDVFLEGLWEGVGTRELVNHLVIVAVDQTAYDRCRFRGLHCYRLVTEGVDFMGEKVYMSSEFIKMMWARTSLLVDILNRGYNFCLHDVIWLRNPFTVLTTNSTQDLDIQFSIDWHKGNDSPSAANPINTGFYYVKSNNKTISLFKKWYDSKNISNGVKEQDVLQNLTRQGVLTDLDIKVRFFETKYFSGFCQDSLDIRSVLTVHANCCRYVRAKVIDLVQVLRDWSFFRYSGSHSNLTSSFRWSPHVECGKSWNTRIN